MDEQTKTPVSVTVLGLGCAGVKILSSLRGMPEAAHLQLLVLDTDRYSLEASPLLAEDKILADEQWCHGQGCGGDFLKGERAMVRERADLEKRLAGAGMLIVVGGLGGGTASGGVSALAGIGARLKIPTIFVVTMPFSLEGHTKRRIGEETLTNILPVADAVVTLPNDLLFSVLPAETSATEAFLLADREIARAILGLSELVRVGNLIPSDIGDLRTILKGRKGYCGIGIGAASYSEIADGSVQSVGDLALARLLESPLSGGLAKLRESDVVICSLLGGGTMTLADMKQTIENFQNSLGESVEVIAGVNSDPRYGDLIQLTAIAVKYDERPESGVMTVASAQDAAANETESLKRKVRSRRNEKRTGVSTVNTGENDLMQPDLALEPRSRGVFMNTTQTLINNEDLDEPTFQRRMVVIDKGRP